MTRHQKRKIDETHVEVNLIDSCDVYFSHWIDFCDVKQPKVF